MTLAETAGDGGPTPLPPRSIAPAAARKESPARWSRSPPASSDAAPRDCGLDGSNSTSPPMLEAISALPRLYRAKREGYLGSAESKAKLFPNCTVVHHGSWDEGTWRVAGYNLLTISWYAEVAPAVHRTVVRTDTLAFSEDDGAFRGQSEAGEKKRLFLFPSREQAGVGIKALKVLLWNSYPSMMAQPLMFKALANAPRSTTFGCSTDGKSKGRPLLRWTADRRNWKRADAVVFVLSDIGKAKSRTTPPRGKPRGQRWIGLSREHWRNPGFPALKKHPLQHKMDHVIDWRLLSDVPASFYQFMFFGTTIDGFFKPHPRTWENRTHIAASIYSNCNTHSKREEYFAALANEFGKRYALGGKCRGRPPLHRARKASRPSKQPTTTRTVTRRRVDSQARTRPRSSNWHLIPRSTRTG